MATIADFLKTGQLGDLQYGMTTDKVRALLGEPEAVGEKPLFWKYGCLETTFYRPVPTEPWRLRSVFVEFEERRAGFPGSLKLTGWLPTPETTVEEFQDLLKDLAVRIDGRKWYGPDDQQLILHTAVRVMFHGGQLGRMSCGIRHKTEFKQVRVEIPRECLDEVRKQSVASGLSIGKLCGRWIEERVAALKGVEFVEREWFER